MAGGRRSVYFRGAVQLSGRRAAGATGRRSAGNLRLGRHGQRSAIAPAKTRFSLVDEAFTDGAVAALIYGDVRSAERRFARMPAHRPTDGRYQIRPPAYFRTQRQAGIWHNYRKSSPGFRSASSNLCSVACTSAGSSMNIRRIHAWRFSGAQLHRRRPCQRGDCHRRLCSNGPDRSVPHSRR